MGQQVTASACAPIIWCRARTRDPQRAQPRPTGSGRSTVTPVTRAPAGPPAWALGSRCVPRTALACQVPVRLSLRLAYRTIFIQRLCSLAVRAAKLGRSAGFWCQHWTRSWKYPAGASDRRMCSAEIRGRCPSTTTWWYTWHPKRVRRVRACRVWRLDAREHTRFAPWIACCP